MGSLVAVPPLPDVTAIHATIDDALAAAYLWSSVAQRAVRVLELTNGRYLLLLSRQHAPAGAHLAATLRAHRTT